MEAEGISQLIRIVFKISTGMLYISGIANGGIRDQRHSHFLRLGGGLQYRWTLRR